MTTTLDINTLLNTRVSHKSPSDLMMVRDWFYPQHVNVKKKDLYAVRDYDEEDEQTARFQSQSQSPSQINATRLRGVRRVMVYKYRDKRTPHFIGATGELVDAVVQYQEGYLGQQQRQRQRYNQLSQHDGGGDGDDSDDEVESDSNINSNNHDEKSHEHERVQDSCGINDSPDSGPSPSPPPELLRPAKKRKRSQPSSSRSLPPPTPMSYFPISSTSMQSIFSTSFCRFVNGFVDRDVVRPNVPSSYSSSSGVVITTDPKEPSSSAATAAARSSSASQEPESEPETRSSSSSSSDSDSDSEPDPKPTTGNSMYHLATQISMPRTFIDFRHKCTHSPTLPSLREQVKMNEEALSWLWERHWKTIESGGPDSSRVKKGGTMGRRKRNNKSEERAGNREMEKEKERKLWQVDELQRLLGDRTRKEEEKRIESRKGKKKKKEIGNENVEEKENDDEEEKGKEKEDWQMVLEDGKWIFVPSSSPLSTSKPG